MIDPDLFWLFASFVYLGFLLLMIDVCLEPEMPKRLKFLLVPLLAIGVLAFSKYWVFVPGPLEYQVTVNPINPLKVPGGINWIDPMSNMEVVLANPTDRTYQDVDLTFHADLDILETQISGIPDCSIKPVQTGDEPWQKGAIDKDPNGKSLVRPFIPSPDTKFSESRYRLFCSQFPSKSHAEIVFALTNPIGPPGIRKLPEALEVSGKFRDMGRYRKQSYKWSHETSSQ
jgi:hypothetical protein